MTSSLIIRAALIGALGTAATTARAADTQTDIHRRDWSLMAQTGWNGIAGVGLLASYSPTAHLALDAGVGLGMLGLKGGLRARYDILPGGLTPFVGVGAFGGTGSGDGVLDVDVEDNPFSFELDPAIYAQGTAGVRWISTGGFTLLAGAGYAHRLTDDPVKIRSGTPNDDQRETLDAFFGHGVVLELAMGYSF